MINVDDATKENIKKKKKIRIGHKFLMIHTEY